MKTKRIRSYRKWIWFRIERNEFKAERTNLDSVKEKILFSSWFCSLDLFFKERRNFVTNRNFSDKNVVKAIMCDKKSKFYFGPVSIT